ncbi:MAG: tRNA pseudouridine(55) synthase TruB [Bacteroidota bacterium]
MKNNDFNFRQGEVILVDKPLHWTSFDVVNKLRWKLKKKYGIKRFKVGHAGTLDPLATGLLLICTGKKTKVSQQLTGEDKTYTGTILLGKTTPSYDLETEFDTESATDALTEEQIRAAAEQFKGVQQQTPPIFSAKKVKGKRAYTSAREGKKVVLEPNNIHIHSFEINTERFPEIDFKVKCSKGTYLRSLAHDFGQYLGVGGTLVALRRTASGDFRIEDAKTVDEWLTIIEATEVEDVSA